MTDSEQMLEVRQSLAPYLARIEQTLKQEEGAPSILLVTPEGPVQLNEWLTGRIRDAMLATGENEPDDLALLVTDALGFRVKAAEDIAREAETPAKGAQAIRLSMDLGRTLASSVQQQVNRLVSDISIDEARYLSAVVGSLVGDLSRLEVRLHELVPASEIADDVDDGDPTSADRFRIDTGVFDDPELLEKQRKAKEEKRKKIKEAEQRKAKRAKIKRIATLSTVFLALIVVWVFLVLIPGLRDRPIDQLTLEDFAGIAAVESVTARPPSIFITVDLGTWNRLSEEQKLQVVRAIGGRLTPTPYSGAIIYTSDEVAVASWLRAKGSRLYVPADPTGQTPT